MTTMKAIHNKAAKDEQTIQRWLTDARKVGQKDSYSARRRHPRFTWNVHVAVTVLDEMKSATPMFATTRDVSIGGLGLKTRQRMAVGTLVRVSRDERDEHVFGRVRYCGEALGGFVVGIEFTQPPSPPRTDDRSHPSRRVA